MYLPSSQFMEKFLFFKFTFLILLLDHAYHITGVSWMESAKWHHPLRQVDDTLLSHLGKSDSSHYEDFNRTLDTILMARVPATDGHTLVRQNILKQMNALGWSVTQDQFSDRTPYGRKNFANIIATADPSACRRLVIACHYDSLYNREYTFLGATDSAVPCAMMIHAARLLNPFLQQQKEKSESKLVTLQLIFFDGEEAFRRWSSTDSLYGSRHLAEKWNKQEAFYNANEKRYCTDKEYGAHIDRIDVMVLLDLLGSSNPKFYSYFPETYSLFKQFSEIEQKLNKLSMLDGEPPQSNTQYFSGGTAFAYIEDDHVPFMKKGVPIVHVIPSPFPHVWHKETDNRQNLHHPTINNLNKILRTFIIQYLHLDVPNKTLVV